MRKIYFNCIAAILSLTISFTILPGCNHRNEALKEQGENEEEHDEYDSPGAAAEFEYRRNIDPATGTVPHERMWQAVLETEALKNINSNSTSSNAALAPLTWIERGSNSDVVGPSNGNTRPGNGVTSGRMKAIWVDIADPSGNTVWVGGVWGGIWKTTNMTAATPTWVPINDFLSNLVVTGICQDPTNPNTMYMATGETGLLATYSIVGIIRGDGVFKSTDHGLTWTQLPSSSTLTNCTKILCDATGNVYVSSVGISPALGLQRSTDGGATWVSINPFSGAATPTSRIVDFEISSLGVMHVVGGLSSGPGIGGYRYTATPATIGAAGWSSPTTPYAIPTGGGARVEIITSGNNIYAAISNADKIDNIGKSTDGGNNWTTTPITPTNVTALNGGGQGSFSNTIGIDPSDPNTIIVGSLNLLKSTDGGASFSKISEWVGTTGQYCHADQHAILWFDNGNKLLVGTDGGLFYSTNKGVTISDKNTGLRLKQFYGVTAHPTLPNNFLCGSQDNGTHQFNNVGLSNSIEVLGGDGGITGIDQDEPQFQAGTYVYANFRRSTNGGASWVSNGSGSTAGLFINPYDYDNAANKIYAGNVAGQFMRWENPHTGFTFSSVAISDFGTGQITSVTSSALTANRAYFGLTNGRVIRLDNADQATPTSTIITPAAMPATVYVTCVAESRVNTQNLIATTANYGVSNVYSTTNGGTNWAECDGNLPDMPVYWAVYHPDGDAKVYIATETGVWSTDLLNGASTVWTPETTFPTVKTSMLKYRSGDRTLAAATYGRGLWTAIIPASCTPPSITSQPTNTSVCSGDNTSFTVTAAGTAPLSYQWQVSTAGAGGPWTNLSNVAPYSGVMTNTLTITAATASMNGYQYRVIVTGVCAPLTATSISAILTITSVPSGPGVTTPVVYCQGATATPLTATGTNLLWYTAATGGTGSSTAPTPSTATVGSITYYVSQTTGCESPRAAITVTVNATPAAPVVTTPITYCQGSAATPLTATGTNLLWYTVATGGTGSTTAPTPSTATVGSTTFYVSQTTGTCEGPRAAIVVNVTASTPAPGVTSPVTYCQGGTAVPLTATGTNLMWYPVSTGGTGSTTAPTPSTATVGSTLYYVSQTTSCGEGPRASITVNVTAPPAAPGVTTPVTYCQGATAVPLTATGSNLLWYTVSTGGTGSATAPTPSTTTVGSTTYYVSQTVGCESPRADITVTVNSTPAAPGVTSPITYCQGATAVPLTATGTNLKYYTVPTGGTGTATAPTPSTATVGSTTYYVSQTTGVCEGPRAAIVVNVIAGTTAPSVATPVNYCQGAAASPLTATGTGLLYYTVATGGPGSSTAPTPSTATAGSITYYVSQTVAPCGEGPRAAITVTVAALPSAPAVSSPVTYCQGATAVPLTATGTGLLYYTAPTGGAGSATAPTPSTAAVGSTTYYVSQAAGSCEGARAAIVVNVTSTPAVPVVTAAASYCQGGTAIPLSATGTNLLYYTTATGGTGTATAPTPSTATIGTTVYYVSQSTGICEGPRAAITVTITAGAAITVQPADITSCSTTATFNVTATGTTLGYQWQVSTDGGTTYTNIGGALSNVLILNNLTAATANYKYRVIVSAASCGSVTSNAVTAKVGTTPVVVLTAAPFTAYNPSITGGLYTTVGPAGVYTYQWTRDGVVLPNVTGPSITAANGLLFEFGAYKVTVTDPATGCAGVSNTVTITDVAGSRNQLFITPNPARDIVRISYYSTVITAQARKINVYDSKGGKIMVKDFTVTGRYGTMNLDLSRMIQGTYMIIVRDAAGNKIASERIIKL